MAGRPPIGERAMTAAERQRRRREKLRAANPRPFASLQLAQFWAEYEQRAIEHERRLAELSVGYEALKDEVGEKLRAANPRPSQQLAEFYVEYERRLEELSAKYERLQDEVERLKTKAKTKKAKGKAKAANVRSPRKEPARC